MTPSMNCPTNRCCPTNHCHRRNRHHRRNWNCFLPRIPNLSCWFPPSTWPSWWPLPQNRLRSLSHPTRCFRPVSRSFRNRLVPTPNSPSSPCGWLRQLRRAGCSADHAHERLDLAANDRIRGTLERPVLDDVLDHVTLIDFHQIQAHVGTLGGEKRRPISGLPRPDGSADRKQRRQYRQISQDRPACLGTVQDDLTAWRKLVWHLIRTWGSVKSRLI